MFNIAQRESVNAFADNTMYLERAVQNPRHVEVQIIADNHGNVVALGERDCCGAAQPPEDDRGKPLPAAGRRRGACAARMMDDAVKAARAVGYTSAGTIEFLLDADRNYYFMEMNTRIQVEHCVTEMVTHTDLVGEMIRVAAGEALSFSQDDIQCCTGTPSSAASTLRCRRRISCLQPWHDFPDPPAGRQRRARGHGRLRRLRDHAVLRLDDRKGHRARTQPHRGNRQDAHGT